MNSSSDRIKGLANEASGKVKQGLGKATDDPETEARGIAQERKGEGQQFLSKLKRMFGRNRTER